MFWLPIGHHWSFHLLYLGVYSILPILTNLSVQKLDQTTCILVVVIDVCMRCATLWGMMPSGSLCLSALSLPGHPANA